VRARHMDAEDPLTSSTPPDDGEAQGHSAHHGRLPTHVYATTKWVFDLKDDDVSGAPPTSAGSRDTPTSCTGRWRSA